MALTTGARLGPYEIVGAIGAGGMGEVYRARDTRLDRIVAIKVLPAHVAADPDARQRFEREARAIAALNHPHICTLHDIGRESNLDFLVMEHLEGETLADRLTQGPLPLAQAVRIAKQVADALAKAHRLGIVHRDLKPGNIFLHSTQGSGSEAARRGDDKTVAKLLDFGLAKAAPAVVASGFSRTSEGSPKAAADASMATSPAPLTRRGTILGTLNYMAPEQLEGREADARSDIFAFGCVLYEMVAGKRAFEGKSPASVMAAILDHDPAPVSVLQPLAPPALERLVRTCLAKAPDDRWESAHDIELQLANLPAFEAAPPLKSEVRRAWMRRLGWAAAGLMAGSALAAGVIGWRTVTVDDRPIRFTVTAPDATYSPGPAAPIVTVSPDGRRLAWTTSGADGRRRLWLRSLDGLAFEPIEGASGAQLPFWSPDSARIGFVTDQGLKSVSVAGGSVQSLGDVVVGAGLTGATWGRDGVVLFSDGRALRRLSVGAGTSVEVSAPAAHGEEHVWPWFLPDGRHYLFLIRSSRAERRGIHVASLDDPAPRRLVDSLSRAAYASGYLLFMREGTLFAQPFDTSGLRLSSEPKAVAEDVTYNPDNGRAGFWVSDSGVLVYRTGRSGGTPVSQPTWYDRQGRRLEAVGDPGGYSDVALSPSATQMAAALIDPRTGTDDIWVFDLGRKTRMRLTFNPAVDVNPTWSPDGRHVAYYSNRGEVPGIYSRESTGTQDEAKIFSGDFAFALTDWSADGRFLLLEGEKGAGVVSPRVTVTGRQTRRDLWLLPLGGNRSLAPLLKTDVSARHARFSPDGRWVAYDSNESGRFEVYVRPFQRDGPRVQVSTSGGTSPQWRADGRELFYASEDQAIVSVDIKLGQTVDVGTPRQLFRTPITWIAARRSWSPTPDGQRFLVFAVTDDQANAPATIVVNWPATLTRAQ